MKKTLSTLIVTAFLATPLLAAESQGIKGVWQTEKKEDENRTAHVEISNCTDNPEQLCGKIIALEEPIDPETGEPKRDKQNPEKNLRDRPVMGLLMLKGFDKKDDMTYVDGTIYSPRTGKTYESKIHLTKDGILKVTGYVFFFSKTQDWTRVKELNGK